MVGNAEHTPSSVWSVPVIRDPDGTVVGFGVPSLVFYTTILAGVETSLEVRPGTETLFFTNYNGGQSIVERLPDGTTAVYLLPIDTGNHGMAFIPPPLPNEGKMLVGGWPSGLIHSCSLTDLSNGFFEPLLEGFYSSSVYGATGDMHFIPAGDVENDLMFTRCDNPQTIVPNELGIIDIDPTTGRPVGGGVTPSVTPFYSLGEFCPWGLEFDPITKNLFVTTADAVPSYRTKIIQITGFYRSPEETLADLTEEPQALADGGSLNQGTLNSRGARVTSGAEDSGGILSTCQTVMSRRHGLLDRVEMIRGAV